MPCRQNRLAWFQNMPNEELQDKREMGITWCPDAPKTDLAMAFPLLNQLTDADGCQSTPIFDDSFVITLVMRQKPKSVFKKEKSNGNGRN